MKIGWYSVVISPKEAREMAAENAAKHIQTEHFSITKEELEQRIMSRVREGAFNYFLYCADLAEVDYWTKYLRPLGYIVSRFPAAPGEKYDYIIKISWE